MYDRPVHRGSISLLTSCSSGQTPTVGTTATSSPSTAPSVAPTGSRLPNVRLQVAVEPREAGGIILSPSPLGVDSYLHGRLVTIFVSPKAGWRIKEWVGPVHGILGDAARIHMDNSHAVAVVMEKDVAYSPAVPITVVLQPTLEFRLEPPPWREPGPRSALRKPGKPPSRQPGHHTSSQTSSSHLPSTYSYVS